MANKVLVIGLDGATFDLIHPWVQAGYLPTLARLLAQGASGRLRSVPNMNSAPAWTSFATGKNPGKHGIFYFTERIPGTYQQRYLNGGFRQARTFWSLLSDAAVRVGVINVPMTYPAEEVNGFLLAGLDAPSIDSVGFSYPEGLARQILREAGEYIVDPGIPDFIMAGRRDRALERLLYAVERRETHTLNLMHQFDWDLLITVLIETDAAQHFFWKDLDPAHPDHNPTQAHKSRSSILEVYRRCDQAISAILDAVDAGTTVIVMSDHGAGHNQRGAEYLNPLLAELGLLHYASDVGERGTPFPPFRDWWKQPAIWGYRQMDKRLPPDTKLFLARRFRQLRSRVEQARTFQGMDWTKTQVYATGTTDDLYINLRGREPLGTVAPGADYEALRDRLIELLLQASDTGSGQPAVTEVLRREEVYHGPYVDHSPDLLIRWNTDQVLSGLRLPDGTTTANHDVPPAFVNGGHRMDGIFIASGPDIRKGVPIQSPGIMDIAPTVLHVFGHPISEDMDGQVLTEIFTAKYNAEHHVTFGAFSSRTGESRQDYRQEDAQIIEDRLRGLGYVE